jgi:hypothetical protein
VAWADEEGRFEVEDLPEGPYRLDAWAPSRDQAPDAGFALQRTLPGVATDAGDLVVSLPEDESPPAAPLDGTVEESGTGRVVGVFGAALRSGDRTLTAEVPSPGRFRFAAVPAGRWRLEVRSEDHLPHDRDLETTGDAAATLAIRLDRGATVSGRVRTTSDGGLRDRTLTFVPAEGDDAGFAWTGAPIAADGTYRASGLAPGRYRLASATMRGWDPKDPPYASAAGEFVEVLPGASDVRHDALLLPAGTLMLSPDDPRLPPAEGVGGPTGEPRRLGAGSRATVLGAAGEPVVVVRGLRRDATGALGFVMLPAGAYRVRYDWADGTSRERTVLVEVGKVAGAP